ncbi:hypothetical protein DIPPA_08963 [Diplonema papillatum]|nr:hypothetical protein DIPPA_08963 [Diplonema papillatum]
MSDKNGEDPELNFYRHRDWKPGPGAASPPVPKTVDGPGSIEKPAGNSGSPWNAAGTWEEKSQKAWAVEALTTAIEGLAHGTDGGEVKVSKLSVTGDASINFIRGKKRYPFDFKLELTIVGPDDMKCTVAIPDFASDEDSPYAMEFSWSGDDAGRTEAARAAVGATQKEVLAENCLMSRVHAELAKWIDDFFKM